MPHALIALGSNLGDRQAIFAEAESRLARLPSTRVLARSRSYETAPVGGPPGQRPFLNAALLLETALAPQALLESLQQVEADSGRRRDQRWGPRSLDLDLLLYDQLVVNTSTFVLPHPRMTWRRFVLEPAAEIAPNMVHPTIGWTIGRLLEHLNGAAPYVAITGPKCAGKTWLANELACQSGISLLPYLAPSSATRPPPPNSSGHDSSMGLQSLEEWARRLAADLPHWSEPGRVWVSDFWFDQAMAVARTELPDDQVETFRQRWQLLRPGIVRPKLIVLLDPPLDCLLERIRRRARPEEMRLGSEALERLRREIRKEAMQPDRGPCLHATDSDRRPILDEVTAAIRAME